MSSDCWDLCVPSQERRPQSVTEGIRQDLRLALASSSFFLLLLPPPSSSSFFLLLLPPPSSSSSFPYTTSREHVRTPNDHRPSSRHRRSRPFGRGRAASCGVFGVGRWEVSPHPIRDEKPSLLPVGDFGFAIINVNAHLQCLGCDIYPTFPTPCSMRRLLPSGARALDRFQTMAHVASKSMRLRVSPLGSGTSSDMLQMFVLCKGGQRKPNSVTARQRRNSPRKWTRKTSHVSQARISWHLDSFWNHNGVSACPPLR